MAPFLSPQWLAALGRVLAGDPGVHEALAAAADAGEEVRISVRQRVVGGPRGDIDYVVCLAGRRAGVIAEPGPGVTADAQITTPWKVAVALSQGSLAPAAAFGAGRMRLGGDVGLLVRHRELLASVGRAAATLGPATTY